MSDTTGQNPDHPRFDVEIRSPKLTRTRDYWLEIKGEKPLPLRSDFILSDLGDVIAHLTVIDVEHDPMRLKFRMLGTFLTDIAGRNSTGKYLDSDLYPDNLEEMTWSFIQCAKSGEPLATEGPLDFADRDWTGQEIVLLPLTDDGHSVSMIVACSELVERREELTHEAGEVIINWRK